MTLAGLLWAAIASQELSRSAWTRLRDAARHHAIVPELALECSLVGAAFEEIGADLPPHVESGKALLALAVETTDAELLEMLASVVAPEASAHIDQAVVMRGGRQEKVELVVIESGTELDPETGRRALQAWVTVEPGRAYYRIDHPASRSVVVLDRESGDWWARKGQGDFVEFGEITPTPEPWRDALDTALLTEESVEESA